MIVYNVTVKVDLDVHDDWLKWMKGVHIPDVMKTGKFLKNGLYRLLIDEADGVTYSVQYQCNSIGELNLYQQEDAPRLQQEHNQRYANKYVAFRSLLEEV